MAHQRIYKHIGYDDEPTWGASRVGDASRLTVTSVTLDQNPNKALVEETTTTILGRDRITIGRNEIDGDISGYATPHALRDVIEWVNGRVGVTSAAGGSSAAVYRFYQNTDNNYLSRTVVLDRNNTQERFKGVRATSLTLNGSDGLIDFSLTAWAQSRETGVSLADLVGVTVKPYEFADVSWQIGNGSLSNATTQQVRSWSITYNNNSERSFLSGSRQAARTDGGVPTIEGTIEIFHEGLSYVSATYGCSDLYLRMEASTVSCQGLIAGVTPYLTRIDIPRAEFTMNTRIYEQAAIAIETITFTGKVAAGSSALWIPEITGDLAFI